MTRDRKVIPLPTAKREDSYDAARERLTENLVQYTLLDSYTNFTRHGQPFPFIEAKQLLPNTAGPALEHPYQNTAFVILLDSPLPSSLVKHFRVRESNRVTWRNIQRLASHLGISDYKSAHSKLSSPQLHGLLTKLSSLDYALLAECLGGEDGKECVLTHMHVKVERLTDAAIEDLGKVLGYIDRGLFERGEDYVDALESKFFEHYGFSANASGRKSAAAMAAQLLAEHCERFSVLVAAQDDCRLTILDESDWVIQYLLIRLDGRREELSRAAANAEVNAEEFAHLAGDGAEPVYLYRLRLRRTAAASSSVDDAIDRSLTEPWLEIADEALIALPGTDTPALPFRWAGSD